MAPELFALPTLSLLAATFLLGGFVKGAAAFGQPMVTIPLTSFFLPLPTAIAVSVIPVFVGNLVQLFQNRRALGHARRFLAFYIALAVGMSAGILVFSQLDNGYVLAVIGVLILIFVTVQLTGWEPTIKTPVRWPVQLAGGACSGVLAGMTSFVSFPSIPLFVACRLERETFAVVLSLMFLLATLLLTIGLSLIGVYGIAQGLAGMLCVLPSVGGQLVGQSMRNRLPERALRLVVLSVLSAVAVSLVVRGLG